MVLEKVEHDPHVSKQQKKRRLEVVDKLPMQEVRTIEKEDEIIDFITMEEALTLMLNASK